MENFLYGLVGLMARVHQFILTWNDAYEYHFSDKYLHFLVIGILGMLLVIVIHPIFLLLAKHKKVMAITFVYVFTLIVVVTFAIEIGQKVTHTGVMEFADIEFGLVGFILMFAIFDIVRLLIHFILYVVRGPVDDRDDDLSRDYDDDYDDD